MQDRFLTRYYDTKTEQIIKLNTIINTCENGIDIEFYGICVSGDGQISQVELDKNEQRFKRMQCTGLKDKNGILIFEGDILKYTSKPTNTQKNNPEYKPYNENYSVVWEDFYTGYNLRSKEKVNCFNLGIMTNDCEVIGNIYENPELIGGAK